jgi:glycosyltransferase involved in cell wall biosynthesis
MTTLTSATVMLSPYLISGSPSGARAGCGEEVRPFEAPHDRDRRRRIEDHVRRSTATARWRGKRMRVLHVVTGLHAGGAETMLYRLLGALRARGYEQEVACLIEAGRVADQIREAGFPCRALGLSRTVPNPAKVLALARVIAAARPDVVQTWMYHADLLGGIAAKLARAGEVVWGVHHTDLERSSTHWKTLATMKLCARLSETIPREIVCVSRATRALHAAAGYCSRKLVVIPNGFDLWQYAPDPAVRARCREELGVAPSTTLVGLVARVHPQKDHENFVRAAALVAARKEGVRFLLCGTGASPDNRELARVIEAAGVLDRFVLLGPRSDVPRIMNALDVAVLSSAFGEAFPLVVGEAMASGVPCAVTDVGDAAELVGDTGRVVPPRDAPALARAVEELVALGPERRRELGRAARARVEACYALPRVAAMYAAVYERVAAGVAPAHSAEP